MPRLLQLDRVRGLRGLGGDDIALQFGNTVLHGSDIMPGTGQTLDTLLSLGYTPDDLTNMLEQAGAAGIITVPGGGVQAGPFRSITVGTKTYGASDIIPGTGVTLAELESRGYTEGDIATIVASSDAANAANTVVGLAPGPSPRISTTPAPASLVDSAMNWFTGSTLISGIPNFALLGIGLVGLSLIGGGGKGRRR